MDRLRPFTIAFALAVCLISGSKPRIPGDGGEYVAMALNFAAFHPPALYVRDMRNIQRIVGQWDPSLAGWNMRENSVGGPDGRRDFFHFWFYSLLAVPPIWVTEAIGVTPVVAFTVLNLSLLGLALWIAQPRLGAATCLLLFGGPIIWWMDKPHTEVFTFSLLVIALTLMRTAPWWSMVAAGAAATQNPPMAVILVSVFAAHVIANRQIVYDRRFLAGAAGGLALAALQPLYTYLRHGSLSLLILANPARRPTLVEILAVPLDPDIGLLANFPVFALVCLVAVGVVLSKRPRALLSAETVIAGTAGVVFLASFAQTSNLHHGATPSMSRYAIWLVPLAIPFIRQAGGLAGTLWKKFLTGAAVVSAAVCAFAFNPDVVANAHEPTLAADFLWTRHPGWNNPLPEIFVETMNEREYHLLPVTTMGCEKLLLMGNPEGMWPIPCLPGNPPNWCRTPGALCYANRATDHYQFARPAGPPIRHEGFAPQPDQTWPAAAEPHVRTLFTEWDWWHLKPRTAGDDLLRLRHDVRVWVLEDAGRFLFVLREVGGNPAITLQLPAPMTGLLVDATSGRTLRKVEFNGAPFERWDVDLDPGLDVVLLPLWPK